MTNVPNIVDLMDDLDLFGCWFRGDSWRAWRIALKSAFGLHLEDAELAIYRGATGRTHAMSQAVTELWLAIGRRGGKSLIAAFVAVYLACFRDYSPFLAPVERATIMLIAADRKQARVVFRYIYAFLTEIKMLAGLITRRTAELIELANRVTIEVHTASFRSVRGYTLAAVINDEIAFWNVEDSAQPDKEILVAQRPALTTIPGALMLNISSPYARRGTMFAAFEDYYGKDASDVLFWKAPSRALPEQHASVEMNPLIDLEIVRRAYEEDAPAAASEWGANFRSDVEQLFTLEMLERITDYDRPGILPYEEEEVA